MDKHTKALKHLTPGDEVWCLNYDESDRHFGFSGYMFLAKVNDYVIATHWINGMTNADETLEYLAEGSSDDYGDYLVILPASDCFKTMDEARASLLHKT